MEVTYSYVTLMYCTSTYSIYIIRLHFHPLLFACCIVGLIFFRRGPVDRASAGGEAGGSKFDPAPAPSGGKSKAAAVPVYDLEAKINAAVFPALQGGPHMNTIAGVATALLEVYCSAELFSYCLIMGWFGLLFFDDFFSQQRKSCVKLLNMNTCL